MQGLADGYFVLPATISNYLAQGGLNKVDGTHPAVQEAVQQVTDFNQRILNIKGTRSVDSFHRELGKIMWEYCGMSRTDAGLRYALQRIPELRQQFWSDVRVLGSGDELNQELEKAGRVADFIELAELMCLDALNRAESCGGHFREESQTADGEALRNDDEYCYVAAWEHSGNPSTAILHREALIFENIKLAQRSYK
jgi:succinate dehydrogenase / fumarate reductase flavoprotein subunit